MNLDIIFPDITSTLQITGCHFGVKPAKWNYPKHHHHLYELLYCQDGEAEQIINGNSIRMQTGDWLFMKAGVRHQTDNRSENHFSFFNMHFDLDNHEMRMRLSTLEYALYPKVLADSTKLPLYIQEIEQIMHNCMLHQTHNTSVTERRLSLTYEDKLALQSFILLIIREIILLQKPEAEESALFRPGTTMHEADTAHAIEEQLQLSALSEVSISQIASELNLSRSQCTKIFNKIYGISPRQYVTQLKLTRAKHLLVSTNWTIEEISIALGFNSASHFSRQFRQGTGVSPAQFRPKHRMGKAES
ncbi:AraC family transcriptional regulator [Paenibacillus solisilvae]|uniref:AraC family transcriptional regulator n=1 Tax=Paenibacillus solisilvae TaxID=2486751 RepID=A0ABW0WA26_9BACL